MSKKGMITFCITVLMITVMLFIVFGLDIFGVIYIPAGSLIVLGIALAAMLLISFTAVCILMAFFEDWKWRHLKRHERWKR